MPVLGGGSTNTCTMADMLSDLRERLDEAATTFWSDAELRARINEGCRDVARRTETLLYNTTVAVTAGNQTYSAPSNLVRIHRLEYQPSGGQTVYPLEYMDFHSMDQVWWTSQKITSGTTEFFTMWGFPPSVSFVLYPTPSQSGVLNVYYYRMSQDLATDGTQDDTSIDVPNGWCDLVANYAEYVCLRKDADPRWQEAKAIYEERLGSLIDVSRRWSDQAGTIDERGRFWPSWLYSSEGAW